MLLARDSHAQLERFFQSHFGNETLRLPCVRVYAGPFAARLTETFKVSAITFGTRVFLAPRLLRRGADGRWRAPAPLVAHEAAHVLQYRRKGYVRFLSRYLFEYAAALRKAEGRGAARHWAAYRVISFEAEARAAEEAYARRQTEGAARLCTVTLAPSRRGIA